MGPHSCVLVTSQQAVGQTEMETEWVASVVSIQGMVQVRRKANQEWETVHLEDRFHAGDMIKVGTNSRAAFVLKNESTLRVDQQSTLVFNEAAPQLPFLIELLNGAVHFFSRVHRSLHLVTPFVNGAVEGTEFVARVDDLQTTITLLEGRLKVFNSQGSVLLEQDQTVSAMANQPPLPEAVVRPRDAVNWTLYYPAIIDFKPDDFQCGDDWCPLARQSVDGWRRGDLQAAFVAADNVPKDIDDPRWLIYRAALQLTVGRAGSAEADLQQAQQSDAQRSDALALQAIAALVQNRKTEAQGLVDQALARPSAGSAANMAASYVQQAAFNLDGALAAAEAAVKMEMGNALAWARLSELHLSTGDRTRAMSAARRAGAIQPELAHTLSVLGFASLAQIKIDDAKESFQKAIEFDSAAPMPRLGLGLAKIRSGQLAVGRRDIEVAAALDPGSSLIRSYLGKAYYEEKRDDPASKQLSVAKELDPADPTPWFYDAIRKQSINRPVEALHDLQTSIDLNDNRSVYRSRLLLDEDLAVRSAGIGQIYRDLGFQQLALVNGWKSVNTDPTNHSAHRFLADSYSVRPRHEIARVSELLQSQMLQPINVTPIQPSLAETNKFVLDGTEPSAPAFNEFSPLFLRNRLALQASGVVGTQDTWGDEIALGGLFDRFSFSLGQFHHETDGFRENNDRKSNYYNAFAQVSLTYKASLLAEYRSSKKENGDLPIRLSGDYYSDSRQETDRQSLRIGGRYSPNPRNDILGTVIASQLDGKDIETGWTFDEEQKGYMAEIQHLFRSERFNLVSGLGYLHGDSDLTENITEDGESYLFEGEDRVEHINPYVYSQILIPQNVIWTLGASVDFFDDQLYDRQQFNPKIGVTWNLIPATTMRAAAFRTFKRNLISDQTLEPTQVAGFNQFFDDGNRTEAWRYGVAIDQELGDKLFAGIEYTVRDLTVNYEYYDSNDSLQIGNYGIDENTGHAYLFWTPHNWISTSIEYSYSNFDTDTDLESFKTLKTHKIPIGVNFFHPLGLFLRLKATFVDQKGDFSVWDENDEAIVVEDSDQFWVADAAIGYRLPKRYGILSIEAKNLFDEGFRFQDTNPSNPEIIPERSVLAKITLSF
jgi:lipoprotein NlpI